MISSKVLNFNNQNQPLTDAGLIKVIEMVIEQKLKALTARARLACQTLTPVEEAGLEKQALVNFLSSQKNSTPEINQAINRIGVKNFQSIAVQIAVQIAGGNFETALDLFNFTVASFTERIANLLNPADSITASHKLAA